MNPITSNNVVKGSVSCPSIEVVEKILEDGFKSPNLVSIDIYYNSKFVEKIWYQ